MSDLDMAVQSLVDHDRQDMKRQAQRTKLVHEIIELVKQRGYYPCVDSDPIVFRCGSVIVEIPTEYSVNYKIVDPLRPVNEPAEERECPACPPF
jgi:hypothetical protein